MAQPAIGQASVWGIVVAGVGGTGVITIGQLLGTAAHIEGKGIVTQDAGGLAQKGGATWSHVLIADTQEHIRTTRVSMAAADLIIGCDPIVTVARRRCCACGWPHPCGAQLARHAHGGFCAQCQLGQPRPKPAWPSRASAVGVDGVGAFDADGAATRLMGDSIYTNPMMLGYAWQKGWVPLGYESLMRAMELNGVAVDNNKAAFEWGRRAAHDWASVQKQMAPAQVIEFKKARTLDTMVARRVEFLTAYQNAAYADTYRSFVERCVGSRSAAGQDHADRSPWRGICSS
jgi:indolepyruvate ferredoxin oxidoreductase